VAGAAELCLFDGHEDLPKCRKLNLRVQRMAAAGRRKRAEAYSPNYRMSRGRR
jgi:hypothetical protein